MKGEPATIGGQVHTGGLRCYTGFMKLQTLSPEKIKELANDEGVAFHDVMLALQLISDLTLEEAMALADDLAFRHSWNMATRLAVFDGIDVAHQEAKTRVLH